jgi:hypothetical protein
MDVSVSKNRSSYATPSNYAKVQAQTDKLGHITFGLIFYDSLQGIKFAMTSISRTQANSGGLG